MTLHRFAFLLLLPIAAFFHTAPLSAAPSVEHVSDSLYNELAHATSPQDSVGILCNLYDLLQRRLPAGLADMVVETARRANDPRTALEIIRYQANLNIRNDSALVALGELARTFPSGDERKETTAFISMVRNMHMARYADEETRKDRLDELLENVTLDPPHDLYEHIVQLHGVCMMLSHDTSGELLDSYMDSLGILVRKLPISANAIRNTYYVHAATIYSANNPRKSINADREVLGEIKRLREFYRAKGRVYRSYDANLYIIYSRLLSNFSILDELSVRGYYDKAMRYARTDSAAARTYGAFPSPDIYLAMYRKDYAKALPLIKGCIDSKVAAPRRMQLLKYMIECAEGLGDKETLAEASRQYIGLLEEKMRNSTHSAFRELQTACAIYEMRNYYGELQMAQKESQASLQKHIIIVSSVVLVILVVLVVVLFRLYRRNKRMAVDLISTNERLMSESENLKRSRAESIRARDLAQKANNLKSDFIKNMSYEVKTPLQAINEYAHLIADCASGEGKKHLEQYANLLDLNSELLSTIVNDVLKLSEIESSPMSIQAQVVNARALCEATLKSVARRVHPGVTLKMDDSRGRVDLFTDPLRVQQILNNLLTNAAKFTSSGSIELSYALVEDETKVQFSVTDTGIGINPDNREKIFERFVKLDRDTQGAGLGLTISRLIAGQLGGTLTLDTAYTGGARFVLVIPKS